MHYHHFGWSATPLVALGVVTEVVWPLSKQPNEWPTVHNVDGGERSTIMVVRLLERKNKFLRF